MMKWVYIFILACLVISAETDEANSVDIKKIVQEQIQKAKEKETDPISDVKTDTIKKAENNLQAPVKDKVDSNPMRKQQSTSGIIHFLTSNTDILKYSVIGLFSAIVFGFVALRRARISKKVEQPNTFKKNIQLVREEKFIKPIDPDLKKIRTNLCLTSKYLNTSDQFVSETARKYNLAKTEIMLAAKFGNQSARIN